MKKWDRNVQKPMTISNLKHINETSIKKSILLFKNIFKNIISVDRLRLTRDNKLNIF